MRILVLGAGGVGAAFAAIARRRDFFDHMVLADLDPGARAAPRSPGSTTAASPPPGSTRATAARSSSSPAPSAPT